MFQEDTKQEASCGKVVAVEMMDVNAARTAPKHNMLFLFLLRGGWNVISLKWFGITLGGFEGLRYPA